MTITTALVAGLVHTCPVPAVAATPIARWEMNEGPDATVMRNAAGSGLNGNIGSYVVTGDGFYRFPFANRDVATLRRVVTVADDSRLDPGTRAYAITFRVRTTHRFGNVIQKGQSSTAGGYLKVQMPKGVVQCLFRGAAGSAVVMSGKALNDGRWHEITCKREADRVVMWVDGASEPRVKEGRTGSIANSYPLSVGGKTHCNQTTVTCDYFAGDLDYVRIAAG